MLCVVYVLRRKGEKLDVVKHRPATGWLYFGQDTRKYYPQSCARLFKDSKSQVDVIAPIDHAHVRHIKGGGLMINGFQDGAGYQEQLRQAWWVLPGPLET